MLEFGLAESCGGQYPLECEWSLCLLGSHRVHPLSVYSPVREESKDESRASQPGGQ
jgi:hypothetical protein